VNKCDQGQLVRVLKDYGEEGRAGKIAKAIIANRPLETTGDLRDVVEKCVPFHERPKTLARVFQV